MTMETINLFLIILLPLIIGLLILAVPKGAYKAQRALLLLAASLDLITAAALFGKQGYFFSHWLGFGINFSLRLYHFSAFIILAASAFSFLVALYSSVFMRNKPGAKKFFSYFLITLSFVNGAVLADNLILMLFFWEGLLITLFAMIAVGRRESYPSAVKAFTIVGVSDLCMMVGIAFAGYIAGTFEISSMRIETTPLASLAFVLLMIGALAKAGAMPFHSWIPDAAIDAPLPFMAFLPAALEKLLGIYFLVRISLDMFSLSAGSVLSTLLMSIGAVTIILAVMMALIQKDYKRLLSYHAVSQVGYMVLGIGTALPVGIVGGLFHMINHAMYKSCLFLSAGAVEKQAGSTDLHKLGGLRIKMPVTFLCFLISAAAICGVPPFNGFFSKELVFDAALERGFIFYLAAAGGAFLTAASFLKLGHAAFLGRLSDENRMVKEAPWQMLLPMVIIAGGCLVFGIYNVLPLQKLIQPILGARLEGHDFSGLPHNWRLVVSSVAVLIIAVLNHVWSVKIKGSALKVSDYIHHAPFLSKMYSLAEKKHFDPYDILLIVTERVSKCLWSLDRGIDWVYNTVPAAAVYFIGERLQKLHNGSHYRYLGWVVAAGAAMVWVFIHSK